MKMLAEMLKQIPAGNDDLRLAITKAYLAWRKAQP